MRTAARYAVVTDLDNTIYDFARYYEAGLAALVALISTEFDFSQTDVASRLRDIYARYGTIEYPFAIEEFPELKSLAPEARAILVRDAMAAFWRNATRQLGPYSTVQETLHHLAQERIPVVAYTDAPIHEAMRRLRALGIDKYFAGIVAQQWFRRKNSTILVLLEELPGHRRASKHLKFVWRATLGEKKPCELIYQNIAAQMDSELRHMVVIGDSIERDLKPAINLGCTGIWASYGKRNEFDEGLLRQVVPDLLPEVSIARQEASGPICEARKFEDIVRHLPIQQVMQYE